MAEGLPSFPFLVLMGFFVGGYGSMIGAGGGFILGPVLLLLFPQSRAEHITAMTLTVVFCNAYGGTWAYAQKGRIDYAAGVLFALAGIPFALLGTWMVHYVQRGLFDVLFAVLLLGLGGYLVFRPMQPPTIGDEKKPADGWETPTGQRRLLIGSIASGYLGLASSLLGIGGGILHVPLLIRVLGFAPHVATATSHFVLAIVTFTGALNHYLQGELNDVLAPTAYLAIGVMMGAPLGAALSYWLRGAGLVRLLAVALMIVGMRLIWRLMF